MTEPIDAEIPITWDRFAPRLNAGCPECLYQFQIRPSLSMQMGMNSGNCSCPSCHTLLHLCATGPDEALCERFDVWLRRTQGQLAAAALVSAETGEVL